MQPNNLKFLFVAVQVNIRLGGGGLAYALAAALTLRTDKMTLFFEQVYRYRILTTI